MSASPDQPTPAWKRWVKSVPVVGPALHRIWRVHFSSHPLCRLLRRNFRRAHGVQVVQIGSNDGQTTDPMVDWLKSRRDWRALLVEPVPALFAKLERTYGKNPRFQFANVAVAEKSGSILFYHLPAEARDFLPGLPSWSDQLGSFDPEHIPRILGEGVRRHVVEAAIPALTLAAVLESHGIGQIDLLQIDTEGADWLILRQLDLRRYRPKVILVEHRHLRPGEKQEMVRFLESSYRLTDLEFDFFAERLDAVE